MWGVDPKELAVSIGSRLPVRTIQTPGILMIIFKHYLNMDIRK